MIGVVRCSMFTAVYIPIHVSRKKAEAAPFPPLLDQSNHSNSRVLSAANVSLTKCYAFPSTAHEHYVLNFATFKPFPRHRNQWLPWVA